MRRLQLAAAAMLTVVSACGGGQDTVVVDPWLELAIPEGGAVVSKDAEHLVAEFPRSPDDPLARDQLVAAWHGVLTEFGGEYRMFADSGEERSWYRKVDRYIAIDVTTPADRPDIVLSEVSFLVPDMAKLPVSPAWADFEEMKIRQAMAGPIDCLFHPGPIHLEPGGEFSGRREAPPTKPGDEPQVQVWEGRWTYDGYVLVLTGGWHPKGTPDPNEKKKTAIEIRHAFKRGVFLQLAGPTQLVTCRPDGEEVTTPPRSTWVLVVDAGAGEKITESVGKSARVALKSATKELPVVALGEGIRMESEVIDVRFRPDASSFGPLLVFSAIERDFPKQVVKVTQDPDADAPIVIAVGVPKPASE